jgi:hypothetical protein
MAKKTSEHILNTSANLLGFCLFVITSFHVSSKSEASRIDEFTGLVAICLSVSSILSFFSIRSSVTKRAHILETIADYFFMASLAGILLIILFITLRLLR